MNLVDLVGWIAAFISGVALLPQALKLFRDRDAAGISLTYWQLLLAVVSSFVVHGSLINAVNVILPNAAMSAVAIWTLILVGRARSIGWFRLFGVSVALFAALVAVDLILGPAVYGAATAIPVSIGLISQIVVIAREPDVSGISPGFLLLYLLMQVSWFTWGMLAVEWAFRISSGVFLVLSVISMAWWIARRAGLPALGRVPDPR